MKRLREGENVSEKQRQRFKGRVIPTEYKYRITYAVGASQWAPKKRIFCGIQGVLENKFFD